MTPLCSIGEGEMERDQMKKSIKETACVTVRSGDVFERSSSDIRGIERHLTMHLLWRLLARTERRWFLAARTQRHVLSDVGLSGRVFNNLWVGRDLLYGPVLCV